MCEDAGSAKTKNEWEAGDRSYRKNSASLSHFRADGIMRPGQEQQPWRSVFCAPPPCYKYNVTTSRTRLSVRDAPTASVFPVCPPFHPKIPKSSLTSHGCVLAHSQCKSSVLLYASGFPIMSPGVFHTPLSPYPAFFLLAQSPCGDVRKCRSVVLLRWHHSHWLIWMVLRSWLR